MPKNLGKNDQHQVNPDISARTHGKVYLVGGGPGDPRLITLRGAQCMAEADVVLYDGLANSQILDLATKSAECISVGKHGQVPLWTQERINETLIETAKQGKTVVRLKGGDPAVFARSAEELEILAESGIPFEVVPGITAALAAASYVGIPITHREHASAVAFVTGQQQTRNEPQPIDWDALARFPGTLVFYMGVTTVEEWTSNLINCGKSPATPAAIVRRCTWSDQTVIRTELGKVAGFLTPASKFRPPVIVIVGDVACLGEDFDWFSNKPLLGCGILLTRPAQQNRSLAALLESLGASVYQQPAIEIKPPSDFSSLDRAISLLKEEKHLGVTFSSANGVNGFFERVFQLGYDARIASGATLACVGPSTASALSKYGLCADITPESNFSAEGLLAEVKAADVVAVGADTSETRYKRWIVTTTNKSSGVLQAGISELGGEAIDALAYESVASNQLSKSVEEALNKNHVQICTVTSSAIGGALEQLLSNHLCNLTPLVLSTEIGSKLSDSWAASTKATDHSDEGILESLLLWWRQIKENS